MDNDRPRNPIIVIVCAFMVMFLGASQITGSGIIYIALLEHYGKSSILTAWVGAIFTSVFSFAGPLCGGIINRFDTRTCIIIGGILNLVGFTASGLSANIYVLFLTYGLIAGTGQALCYGGCFVVVGFYFKKYRSLAFGVIATGFAIGQTVYPTLNQVLLDIFGVNGTFLLLGAMGFQVCVFGAIIRPHPLEIDRDMGSNSRSFIKQTVCKRIKSYLLEHLEMIKNPAISLLLTSFLCWNISLAIFTLFLTDYYHSTGSPLLEASFLTSIVGFGSMLSRILSGLAVVDSSIDGKILYFGSYGFLGISTLLLPLYGKYYEGKIYYSIVYGLYTGSTWPLTNQITVDIVGIYKLAMVYGMETFMAGAGFLIGPIIGSKIMELDGDYNTLFIYAGFMYFLASIFGLLMTLFAPQSSEKHITEKDIEITADKLNSDLNDTEAPVITEKSVFIPNENKEEL